jgi:hypothetical protein
VDHISNYWKSKKWDKTTKLYLICDGSVTDESRAMAISVGVEIWDIYKLYELTTPQIRDNIYKTKSSTHQIESQEKSFARLLQGIEGGHENWMGFQKLIGEILSYLFVPPLSPPKYEHDDAEGRNRRDLIFENSSEQSFWKGIREVYRGYYIVVDAKNNKEEIDKKPVLDIAHYLKPYGCGMFGILVTRLGAAESADHAIKEQWIGNGKMIVVLHDNDILEMLKLKPLNKSEEIIRTKIAEFRMRL